MWNGQLNEENSLKIQNHCFDYVLFLVPCVNINIPLASVKTLI